MIDDDPVQELVSLREGLVTRTLIGQATGLMAAQYDLSLAQAWHLLRTASSLANVKVRDVARLMAQAHDGTLGPDDLRPAADITRALPEALRRARASAPDRAALRQQTKPEAGASDS